MQTADAEGKSNVGYLEQEKESFQNEIRRKIERKITAHLLEHPDKDIYVMVSDLTELFPKQFPEDPELGKMTVAEMRRFVFKLLNMAN